MIDFALNGDLDKARELHYKYLPVFKGLFNAPNPTCLKYVLSKLGIMEETLRLPLVPLTAAERIEMDKMIEAAELMVGSKA